MISGNKIQKNVLVTSDGVCAGHVVTVVTPPSLFYGNKIHNYQFKSSSDNFACWKFNRAWNKISRLCCVTVLKNQCFIPYR